MATDGEKNKICLFVLTESRHVTDERTDRRTRPRLHSIRAAKSEMTHCKFDNIMFTYFKYGLNSYFTYLTVI